MKRPIPSLVISTRIPLSSLTRLALRHMREGEGLTTKETIASLVRGAIYAAGEDEYLPTNSVEKQLALLKRVGIEINPASVTFHKGKPRKVCLCTPSPEDKFSPSGDAAPDDGPIPDFFQLGGVADEEGE